MPPTERSMGQMSYDAIGRDAAPGWLCAGLIGAGPIEPRGSGRRAAFGVCARGRGRGCWVGRGAAAAGRAWRGEAAGHGTRHGHRAVLCQAACVGASAREWVAMRSAYAGWSVDCRARPQEGGSMLALLGTRVPFSGGSRLCAPPGAQQLVCGCVCEHGWMGGGWKTLARVKTFYAAKVDAS